MIRMTDPAERISDEHALAMLQDESLHELGAAAHRACCARHPEPYRTFAIDRNINYTNACVAGCRFCAFSVRPGADGQWILSRDEMLAKVAELAEAGGTHVLLQGGMHPDLDLAWHEQMLRDIRDAFPRIGLHALSPPEIWSLAERADLSVEATLDRLREAGLDTIPGGGAEILVDRVRQQVSPGKCSADQWLGVMQSAHAMGIHATATMMFGHEDTPADRIEHLRRLREVQDESLAGGKGRFTAFICWTFQPGHTPLQRQWRDQGRDDPHAAGAYAYLRMLATARLYLDNFDNLQASWVTQGEKIGQLALFYGANDMGGAMMEENVVAAAGTTHKLSAADLRHLIEDAGWQARQRDVLYHLVD